MSRSSKALANGRARIPGFLLIALYVDPAVVVHVDGESVRADLVSRFVRRYYEEAEGAHEPWDPELARLLAVIDRVPTIALLPSRSTNAFRFFGHRLDGDLAAQPSGWSTRHCAVPAV